MRQCVRTDDIGRVLLETKDPEKCVHMLLGRYELPQDSKVAMGAFTKIRNRLMTNAAYRRTEYERDVTALANSLPEADPDRPRLLNVLGQTLRTQYNLFAVHRRFLDNPETQTRFWQINPCVEWLAGFRAPEQVYKDAGKMLKEQRIRRQHHQVGDKGDFEVSEEEINRLINLSLDIIQRPVLRPKDYFDCIHAVGILSGRRQCEIACFLHWEPTDHPYQCVVSGLAKKIHFNMRNGPPKFTIPLLCTWDQFNDAMVKIRGFRIPNLEENANEMAHLSNGLGKRVRPTFGRKRMGHTFKRNIYLHAAFKRREVNGFRTGDDACSPPVWKAHALGEPYMYTTIDSYNIINIT